MVSVRSFANSVCINDDDQGMGVDADESVSGSTLAWYFDGQKLIYPLVEFSSPVFGLEEGMGEHEIRSVSKDGDCCSIAACSNRIWIRVDSPRLTLQLSALRRRDGPEGVTSSRLLTAARERRFHFEGEMAVDGRPERIKGIGYWQRVSFHAPLLPWHWHYAVFSDGSVAAVSAIYVGLNLLRGKHHLWPSQLENFGLYLASRGYFIDGRSEVFTRFDRARVRVYALANASLDHVEVEATSRDGDVMRWSADVTDRVQLTLRRAHVRGILATHYLYSAHVGEVRDAQVSLGGSHRNMSDGPCEAYTNFEHTTGLLI